MSNPWANRLRHLYLSKQKMQKMLVGVPVISCFVAYVLSRKTAKYSAARTDFFPGS